MAISATPPVITVPLSSPRGIEMFLETEARTPYWKLSQFYETQMTATYCAIASTVMILNTLEIPRPPVERLANLPLFTQENFISDQVAKIVKQEIVLKQGITLSQLSQIVETFDIPSTTFYANNTTLEFFRKNVIECCSKPDCYLIVNYYRPVICQKGGGHFSPIAAYNALSDSVLILDTAKYKHTATWIGLPQLFESMQTIDADSNDSRGWILITK